VLYWEGDGFVIWSKRLEQGTFSGCFSGRDELSRQQFTVLLEGIVQRRRNKRFTLWYPDQFLKNSVDGPLIFQGKFIACSASSIV
jgi:hypothetical protein